MDYILEKDFDEYCGTISNMHGFVHRYLDTGFKTKWAGFWVPPYKFLDYFAFQVNGTWLSPKTLFKTEYGDKMVFHHDLDCLTVEEVVETPEDVPGFRVTLKFRNNTEDPKAVHTKMELGVDIRHKSEDVHDPSYKTEFSKKKMIVESYGRRLMVSSEQPLEKKGETEVKEHFPGEKQVCIVPGELCFKKKIRPEQKAENIIEFTTNGQRFGKLEEKENSISFGENHEIIERSFTNSEKSLRNLVYDRNGKGIIAGHPWFQEYWGRDAFWAILGLIDLGYFEFSLEVLQNFAKQDNFPNQITLGDEEAGYLGEDVPPLFIIAAKELEKHYKITDEIHEKMIEAMGHLNIDKNNVVDHIPEGTWMDTLERKSAIDIHSLWLEATKMLGASTNEMLEKGLEEFDKNGVLTDCRENDNITANIAIPIMFGHHDGDKTLEKLNSELINEYGAATLSIEDEEYSSSSYHKGSTWGLTTGWLAAANLKKGELEKGLGLLKKFSKLMDRDQPGAFPEIVDSDTGENLGCVEQAWSASMIVHAIDRYLFGIDIKDGELVADPLKGFNGTRKYKRFKDNLYHIRCQNGEAKINKVV